jgi:uncharacterized membrane protein YbjE (DUF340 family)
MNSNLSGYALYLLMFLVGISVGGDRKTWKTLKEMNLKIVLVPLTVIVGSLLGAGIMALVLNKLTLKEGLAVGAGFGYYSLSSIIITKFYSETLGAVALMSNMIREILTLLLVPLIGKYFGKLAPIASGGATSMDTTLPIITQSSGKDYAIISVFSGVVLTILVPFLVTFIVTR